VSSVIFVRVERRPVATDRKRLGKDARVTKAVLVRMRIAATGRAQQDLLLVVFLQSE
jgi:hypothetical protein